jgi:hypothetical protein
MALGDGIRRNITSVSEEERLLFVAAIRQLDSGSMVYPNNLGRDSADSAGNITYWDMMEEIHKDGHAHGTDVHAGPAFIPWHRAIVNHFEELLRMVDPRLSLHYWDWTTDPRTGAVPILGPTGFLGSANGNAGAPFHDFASTEPGHPLIWRDVAASTANGDGTPNLTNDAVILASPNFSDFHAAAQSAHNNAHVYIGGTLSNSHYSFHDPFVFLLHSNLDRLWATWQRAPGHPERLDVNIDPLTGTARAYGNVLADQGLPSTYYDELVQPWAGGAANTLLEPWRSDVSQQIYVMYREPPIVLPPSYDTAVHSAYVVTDRDTFSSYEVVSSHSYPQAFYVIFDGFTPNELGGATPTISFHDGSISGPVIASISALGSGVIFENAAALDMPQRISFTFEVNFADTSAFAFVGEERSLVLKAVLGSEVCAAAIHLINQPNPYMLDVQPGGTNPFWLSTDVRVFQLRPGKQLPLSSTTLPASADRAEAYQYIRDLLDELRLLGNSPSPFDFISQDEQASQLELSRTVSGVRVFNFALAKVRYRADMSDAADVRVFFRGFNMMSSALDYTNPLAPDGNYRRSASGTAPLLGIIGGNIGSIPYFAQERIDSASDHMGNQVDDTNKLTINHIANQEAVAYFGCWLDFNQTDAQFPLHPAGDGHFSGRQSIFQLVRGIHQCLVAEVRFQPGTTDPIAIGASPGSSDRLSQRNLAIVESDNPGSADTHMVQHTLTVKPSVGDGEAAAEGTRRPRAYDELVIHWNNLPRDTRATLYFPEWNVDDILRLATTVRQRPDLLKKVDAHTLECVLTDISYIPVPATRNQPYAGLMTLALPQTVRDGEVFHVDVQQHSGTVREFIGTDSDAKNNRKQLHFFASTRKVLGAFRITVAVKIGDGLLRKAVRNLAALRYIAEAIPPGDRWYLVFSRYIKQLAGQVDALGYDSTLVKPSPDDPGLHDGGTHTEEYGYTGKVHQVFYDCHGGFTGFTLETCGQRRMFETCERGIERVVLDACRNNSTLRVSFDGKRICQLIIACC